MRISDWSSDVCSSDLPVTVSSATPYGALIAGSPLEQADAAIILLHGRGQPAQTMLDLARQIDLPTIAWVAPQAPAGAWYTPKYDAFDPNGDTSVSDACTALAEISSRLEAAGVALDRQGLVRSEEHTSELQSLMRTSYAVFC